MRLSGVVVYQSPEFNSGDSDAMTSAVSMVRSMGNVQRIIEGTLRNRRQRNLVEHNQFVLAYNAGYWARYFVGTPSLDDSAHRVGVLALGHCRRA